MFSIGPIVLEIIFVLLKPQEIWPVLATIQPLYTIPGLIVVGFVFDAGRYAIGAKRIAGAPFLEVAIAFVVWMILTTSIKAPDKVSAQTLLFAASIILILAISHALQTPALYRALAASLLGMALFLSYVAVDQAMAPTKCFFSYAYDPITNIYTPKPCEKMEDCPALDEEYEGPMQKLWKCEKPGLMNTSSIDGRVRFRGYLEDPNEFSLATAMGLPFALAFWERRKRIWNLLLAIGSFLLIGACIFFSQSRGAQVALLAVLAVKFVQRFGFKKGAIVGAVAAVPLLIVGGMTGRKSQDAEGSTQERLELLSAGIEMVKTAPIIGVGKGQFEAHEFMTAHNSYVLAASELGLVGFFLWSLLFYTALKIPITAIRELKGRPGDGAAECVTWSWALIASLIGAMIGIFFLSWAYHNYLWIYFGVSGALFGIVRKELPSFRVRWSGFELGSIFAVNVILLGSIYIYTRIKLAGH